jgi:4-carboxymuconolactone decarboxylase
MARVPLTTLEEQPEPIRQWMGRRGNLNVFRLLANAPHVFVGWTHMVDELFDSPTFTLRMREVIILRVAHLQGSRYELSQHVRIARTTGLSGQQISAIIGGDDLDSANFSRPERTALAVTTELCTTHRLLDDTFAAARNVFGDEALTELLMIVSCYYGLALVLNAVDLDVDATARLKP